MRQAGKRAAGRGAARATAAPIGHSCRVCSRAPQEALIADTLKLVRIDPRKIKRAKRAEMEAAKARLYTGQFKSKMAEMASARADEAAAKRAQIIKDREEHETKVPPQAPWPGGGPAVRAPGPLATHAAWPRAGGRGDHRAPRPGSTPWSPPFPPSPRGKVLPETKYEMIYPPADAAADATYTALIAAADESWRRLSKEHRVRDAIDRAAAAAASVAGLASGQSVAVAGGKGPVPVAACKGAAEEAGRGAERTGTAPMAAARLSKLADGAAEGGATPPRSADIAPGRLGTPGSQADQGTRQPARLSTDDARARHAMAGQPRASAAAADGLPADCDTSADDCGGPSTPQSGRELAHASCEAAPREDGSSGVSSCRSTPVPASPSRPAALGRRVQSPRQSVGSSGRQSATIVDLQVGQPPPQPVAAHPGRQALAPAHAHALLRLLRCTGAQPACHPGPSPSLRTSQNLIILATDGRADGRTDWRIAPSPGQQPRPPPAGGAGGACGTGGALPRITLRERALSERAAASAVAAAMADARASGPRAVSEAVLFSVRSLLQQGVAAGARPRAQQPPQQTAPEHGGVADAAGALLDMYRTSLDHPIPKPPSARPSEASRRQAGGPAAVLRAVRAPPQRRPCAAPAPALCRASNASRASRSIARLTSRWRAAASEAARLEPFVRCGAGRSDSAGAHGVAGIGGPLGRAQIKGVRRASGRLPDEGADWQLGGPQPRDSAAWRR